MRDSPVFTCVRITLCVAKNMLMSCISVTVVGSRRIWSDDLHQFHQHHQHYRQKIIWPSVLMHNSLRGITQKSFGQIFLKFWKVVGTGTRNSQLHTGSDQDPESRLWIFFISRNIPEFFYACPRVHMLDDAIVCCELLSEL